MSKKVTFLVLVRNEEAHIKRCLDNLVQFKADIYIVDSQSSDRTLEIASSYPTEIFQSVESDFAGKLNWALDNITFKSDWIVRVDADEILDPFFLIELGNIDESLIGKNVSGLTITRKIFFREKFLRFGGLYPRKSLRVWRTGKAYCESRLLDEHMIMSDGDVDCLNSFISDIPLISIGDWINKHNHYASLEAQQCLDSLLKESVKFKISFLFDQSQLIRYVKESIYYRLPLYIRPFLNFFYTYIIRLGFLDGQNGFIWAVLHSFWYRFLVDIKVSEMSKKHE